MKWLRMLGYDTDFFTSEDDWQMVICALRENRIILTKDTGIMKYGVVDNGKVKAVHIDSNDPEEQIRQVNNFLDLDLHDGLFTRCMECNNLLEQRTVAEVKDRVPPYVYKTQEEYMECPVCNRIYWKGTHWQAMVEKLQKFTGS
ncbi:MAG TPA: hypothetical protein G4O15_06940 [Dehalococcoidia bacterium]|nr:hypothetical protein [Dehalococcoidia bacterium]